MSDTTPTGFDPQLLDWRLGQLNGADAESVAHRRETDPGLARQDEQLQEVLAVLAADRAATPAAPAGLHDRVIARVRAAEQTPRLVPAAAGATNPRPQPSWPVETYVDRESERRFVIRPQNLREIIAVAAVIILAVGLGVPSLLHVRDRNARVLCSNNLASLGQGLSMYGATFNDAVPFAGWTSRDRWRAVDEPGVQVVHNRRHLFPLVENQLVNADAFICPASDGAPLSAEQIANHNAFTDERNISYAYQNMAGVRPRVNEHPLLPILSDDNPLFENGRPLLDFARYGFTKRSAQNSRSHAGDGQNILTLDGHVQWHTTPAAGIAGDNIWTLKNIASYTGREGPETASDAHLLR